MHVSVEKIVMKDLREEYSYTVLCQPFKIDPKFFQFFDIVYGNAMDSFLNKYISSAEVPMDLRDFDDLRSRPISSYL
jgi:hypothetical protein